MKSFNEFSAEAAQMENQGRVKEVDTAHFFMEDWQSGNAAGC